MSGIAWLAQVRRTTGKAIRLGPFEEPINADFSTDRIVVAVNRARVKETRRGLEITQRGMTLYEFRLVDSTWQMQRPFTQWWSIAPELHTSWPGKSPDEYTDQRAWEEMCYRPGTPDSPMDNAARRAQGIK